ncbi:hypothetical protein TNCV_4352721 [Trichonephila clavipes]|nr:hypothetical protein TNCV_4352721 [Trichonephila clavipes]
MSSTSNLLSNGTSPDLVIPLALKEIEAQGRADKHTDKRVFTGFNKMDNVVSVINSERAHHLSPCFGSSSSCPGLSVKKHSFSLP